MAADLRIVADILWWTLPLETGHALIDLGGVPRTGDCIELLKGGTTVWVEVVTVVWKRDGSVYLKLLEPRPYGG